MYLKDSQEMEVPRCTSKQTTAERKAIVGGLGVKEGRKGGKPPRALGILGDRCMLLVVTVFLCSSSLNKWPRKTPCRRNSL